MKKLLLRIPGFSLVEVVLALGLVTFVLVAMVGLFSVGLNGTRDSEQSIGAANLASEMINKRLSTPTNALPALAGKNFALPILSGITATAPVWQTGTAPVGAGGYENTSRIGTYKMTYAYWTDPNSVFTGKKQVKIHLILSAPYDAPLTNATTRYEVQASYLPQ